MSLSFKGNHWHPPWSATMSPSQRGGGGLGPPGQPKFASCSWSHPYQKVCVIVYMYKCSAPVCMHVSECVCMCDNAHLWIILILMNIIVWKNELKSASDSKYTYSVENCWIVCIGFPGGKLALLWWDISVVKNPGLSWTCGIPYLIAGIMYLIWLPPPPTPPTPILNHLPMPLMQVRQRYWFHLASYEFFCNRVQWIHKLVPNLQHPLCKKPTCGYAY